MNIGWGWSIVAMVGVVGIWVVADRLAAVVRLLETQVRLLAELHVFIKSVDNPAFQTHMDISGFLSDIRRFRVRGIEYEDDDVAASRAQLARDLARDRAMDDAFKRKS